jgi:hypothetical protein
MTTPHSSNTDNYYDDLALSPPTYSDVGALEALPSAHYAAGSTNDSSSHYARIDAVSDHAQTYSSVFMGDQELANENAAAAQQRSQY